MAKGAAPDARSPIHFIKEATPPSTQSVEWQTKDRIDNPVNLETQTVKLAGHEMATQENAPEFVASALGPEQQEVIHDYMDGIYELLDNDPSARVEITIGGRSSDESEIDSRNEGADLGVASPNNAILAEDYQQKGISYAEQLSAKYGDRVTFVEGDSYEVILSEENAARITALAEAHGLTDEDFMIRYNANREQLQLDDEEKKTLDELIDKNRGAEFTSTITRTIATPEYGECDVIYQQVFHRAERGIPGSDGWRIDVFGGFIPKLPRRKKHEQVKTAPAIETTSKTEALTVEQTQPTEAVNEDDAITDELYPAYLVPAKYRIVKVKPLRFRQSRMSRAADTVKDFVYDYEDELKRAAIGAAVVAGAAVIPWHESHETTPAINQEQLACGVVTTESSHQEFSSLYFPVIEKVGKLFGHDLDTHFMHSVGEVPGSVKTTVVPHNVITLDPNGNKIDEYHVPESEFDGRVDIQNDK